MATGSCHRPGIWNSKGTWLPTVGFWGVGSMCPNPMATQSCHRISQGIWFSVFQYIGIPLTDYPCQILWQLGVAIGFWVSSFRVQNPMVCSPWFNLWKHWPRMFWFDFLFLESWNTLCSLTCGVPLGPCDVFMTSGFCAEPVISYRLWTWQPAAAVSCRLGVSMSKIRSWSCMRTDLVFDGC